MKNWIWIAALVALVLGCSGKSDKPPVALQGSSYGGNDAQTTGGRNGGNSGTSVGGGGAASGGSRSDTGGSSPQATSSAAGGASTGGITSQGTAGSSTLGGTGGVDALAPVVQITNPVNIVNPNSSPTANQGDGVLTGGAGAPVNVICSIVSSPVVGAPVLDKTTIKLTLTDTKKAVHNLNVTANGNNYAAQLQLNPADIPFGPITITCSASDSSKLHVSTDTIYTYVDYGPTITVASPSSSARTNIFSRSGANNSAVFDFKIVTDPLVSNDEGAVLGNVTLQIGNATIPKSMIKQDANDQTLFTANVSFSDSTIFKQTLTGTVSFNIQATDQRGAISQFTDKIIVDGSPPIINITSPTPNYVVSRQTLLKFTVLDETGGSGVSSKSVSATVGGITYYYDPTSSAWSVSPTTGEYSFTFDSRTLLKITDSQASLSVQAQDLAGNVALPEQVLVYVDNVAPFVSMDPPNIRLIAPYSSAKECSAPFDPLGPHAPGMGMIVNELEHYRAFVWDLTNGIPSQDVVWFAGVDANKVNMYVQPDPTKAVIVDTDNDGICDDIDSTIKQLPNQPQMAGVSQASQGAPNFNPSELTSNPPVPSGVTCIPNTAPATNLCLNGQSDMTVVVKQPYGGQASNSAAIYAIQPPSNFDVNSLICTGSQWNVTNLASATTVINEGWICMAVAAYDSAGNRSVSAPIAVCYDDELTSYVPTCATGNRWTISTEKPPACITDGCTPITWDTAPGAGLHKPPIISYLQ